MDKTSWGVQTEKGTFGDFLVKLSEKIIKKGQLSTKMFQKKFENSIDKAYVMCYIRNSTGNDDRGKVMERLGIC